MDDKTKKDIKHLLLNSPEPLVLKNVLKWPMLKWSLNDWKTILGEEKLKFRCGHNAFTETPQWESTTEIIDMKFEKFLELAQSETQWYYFDYKYLKEWLINIKSLQENIKWQDLGFPEFSYEDSTIWIGSKGSHTPCHIDTYGCNLIAQIFGRKQWLVFPPEEDLIATRVPYEESSIYSELNFFSPTVERFKNITKCKKIVLEPGDVLFLPHKWWHYVESLDTTISVNVWIPLSVDDKERFSESIVQFLVNMCTKLDEQKQNIVLNPNSHMEEFNIENAINLIWACKDMCYKVEGDDKKLTKVIDFEVLIENFDFIEKIPFLIKKDFDQFINRQSNRFEIKDRRSFNNFKLCKLISAITQPEVISVIEKRLLAEFDECCK